MASPIQNSQPQGQSGQMGQSTLPGQQQGIPKSQQGTGYTNLQTLMNANQGNQLGSAVAGGIENTGQQASSALNNGVQNFNTNSQANALGTQAQQQYVQNTLGNLGIGANGQPTSNPSNVTTPSSNDVSNFQQYMQGQYGGPTNIANISGIQNQAQSAQQQGQDVSSSGGRQALLQQYAANPKTSYNQGDQSLDTTLLGATGGNQLQQARQSVSGLTNQVNSAQSAAQQQAAQLQNQAQGFGQAVTGQVTGASNNVYGAANQAAQQANTTEAQNQAAEQQAAQAAQNGQLTAQEAAALGLDNGTRTYGVNVGQYIGYNPANEQATALNVMNQPQYQQYSGLQSLLGNKAAAQGTAYQGGNTTYNQIGLQGAISNSLQPLAADQQKMQAIQNLLNTKYASPTGGSGIGGQIAYGTDRASIQQQLAEATAAYNNLNGMLGGSVNITNPSGS